VRRGFTLVEVVVALLVLEVAVVAVGGSLTVASRTLGRAERLERAVALAEGVLDSLAGVPVAVGAAGAFAGGEVRWEVGDSGSVTLVALGADRDTLFVVRSRLPLP
jgi:hypothetical protein